MDDHTLHRVRKHLSRYFLQAFSTEEILKRHIKDWLKINDPHNPHNKIPALFHNLKSYDSHLVTQELGKSNLRINVIPNGLEKYVSFTIDNKLSFIDSFQLLSASLDSLVKNLCKNDFKFLSQEFDNNLLGLVKEKGFCPYEYMSDFEKFKKELPSREQCYSSLTGKEISDRDYENVLNI